MNFQTTHSPTSQSTDEAAVRALYQQLMDGWNQGSGETFAAPFGEWRLTAFQNTRIRPIGRNAAGTFVWILSDWLWKLFRPKK
jgi:hypothetical protein